MVRAGGCWASQRLRVWWNRSTLPWVWGWPAAPFFWVIVRAASRYSKAFLPPGEPCGVHASVVGQGRGGQAVFVAGVEELGDDAVAGDAGVGGGAQEVAGVVIKPVEDFHVGAVGQTPMHEV